LLGFHSSERSHIEAFRRGLRDLGYMEGQNIVLESRWGEGKLDRLSGLAAELVRLKVDIIVAGGTEAIAAAQQATKTTPIVMALTADAVAVGFVASLARPGGNITGLSSVGSELYAKRLEFIKQIVPIVTRVAVLWNPANPAHRLGLKVIEGAARSLGVDLRLEEVSEPKELDGAFSAMARARAGALLVLADDMFFNQLKQIVQLAARTRLPAVYWRKQFVDAGGLLSYGPDNVDSFRRAATYVDKILKGAKPADLPVEQPTTFELVINLKTARALGLTIPQSILVRADQVIQ